MNYISIRPILKFVLCPCFLLFLFLFLFTFRLRLKCRVCKFAANEERSIYGLLAAAEAARGWRVNMSIFALRFLPSSVRFFRHASLSQPCRRRRVEKKETTFFLPSFLSHSSSRSNFGSSAFVLNKLYIEMVHICAQEITIPATRGRRTPSFRPSVPCVCAACVSRWKERKLILLRAAAVVLLLPFHRKTSSAKNTQHLSFSLSHSFFLSLSFFRVLSTMFFHVPDLSCHFVRAAAWRASGMLTSSSGLSSSSSCALTL
jgi:hypothetical protein